MATSDKKESIQDWPSFVNGLKQIKNPATDCQQIDEPNQLSPEQLGHNLNIDPEADEKSLTRADMSYINKLLNSKLVETKESDIEILRSDPNHPLHSVKQFQDMNLGDNLMKGIAEMNFVRPSGIQEKALPCLITDHPQNMIAQSQSGTGKTATFLLAMLYRVNPDEKVCQCLCMVPTRELAIQIANVCKKMARYMEGVNVGLAIRDEQQDRLPIVENGLVANQVVIGTPGTVFSWTRGKPTFKLDAKRIRVYVLDEADIMIEEDGFQNISMRVKDKLSPTCQILLFSATYDEKVLEFAHDMIKNPVEIRVRRTQLTLKNIEQFYLSPPDWQIKYAQVADIYGSFTVGQAIIFCATRLEAHWLKTRLEVDGHAVSMLSGDLDVKDREQVIMDFRKAKSRVLISTNVCARGLDIPQVNLVINWNMPVTRANEADCETYLHRIGRSGRFGNKGLAINFIGPDEIHILRKLEEHFGITIPLLTSDDLEGI